MITNSTTGEGEKSGGEKGHSTFIPMTLDIVHHAVQTVYVLDHVELGGYAPNVKTGNGHPDVLRRGSFSKKIS